MGLTDTAPNRLAVSLGPWQLRTPLMTASGTSGSSNEMDCLRDRDELVEALGAFVTKGVSLKPRTGNPELRVLETRTGLINSIGLQNKGAESFVTSELPQLIRYELPVIVNISAGSVEEFGDLARYLAEQDVNRIITAVEINVSCPNICEGGMAFGTNPALVEQIVRCVKEQVRSDMLVVTKLTPNVTDITEPARGAIAGGTDALSMINTLRGMGIDIDRREPFLGNVFGGLSGPAIKPVGLAMVYECFRRIPECRKRQVPIIGIGGISSGRDALEYLMAGATAVGVGTAWFVHSGIFQEIRAEMAAFLEQENTTVDAIIGVCHEDD